MWGTQHFHGTFKLWELMAFISQMRIWFHCCPQSWLRIFNQYLLISTGEKCHFMLINWHFIYLFIYFCVKNSWPISVFWTGHVSCILITIYLPYLRFQEFSFGEELLKPVPCAFCIGAWTNFHASTNLLLSTYKFKLTQMLHNTEYKNSLILILRLQLFQ